MGNILGKYGEWEVDENEVEIIEEMVVEAEAPIAGVDAPVNLDEQPPQPAPTQIIPEATEQPPQPAPTQVTPEAKPKRGRTNSGLKPTAVIEEIVVEEPKPKLARPKSGSGSNLKRKRTESFSSESATTTVTTTTTTHIPIEEPIFEEIVEKRVAKKKNIGQSPKNDKLAVKAELVGGTIPSIIDHSNYSRLTREELVTQPRRSLRQTPLKEEKIAPPDVTPKSIKKARVPKLSPVKQEQVVEHIRTPSPKRKLFSPSPKKDTPGKRGRKPSKKFI